MKPSMLLALTTGLIAGVSACNPVYYVPNTHNVPALRGRGDGAFAVQEGRAVVLMLSGPVEAGGTVLVVVCVLVEVEVDVDVVPTLMDRFEL